MPYIFDSFWIVAENERDDFGEYRSKRVIIDIFDEMARLPAMRAVAPSAAGGTIALPDVSLWRSRLQPPPADPAQAHGR